MRLISMSAQNIFSENESNADNDLTRNPPVEKIMGLLGNEFINLKKVIDNRIEIKKWYSEKISEQYQLISKIQEEKEGEDDDENENKIEENAAILKNGLLQPGEAGEYENDLAKIKHNIIVKYLQEKIVVDRFMRCVKKAEKEVNHKWTELFVEKCGFLQEINFEFGEINDDNKELLKTIKITKGEIVKIASFVDQCWKLFDANKNKNKNLDKQKQDEQKDKTREEYFIKEIKIFLHRMFFEKMCGRKLTDIARKTEIQRDETLRRFFELKNENDDQNQSNNSIFLNDNNDNNEIKTNISNKKKKKNYQDYVYEMPKDADVVNELYELEKDDFLRKKREKKEEEKQAEEEYKKYEPVRKLEKEKLTKLAALEQNIDVTKFNTMLCALISNPNFIQTIAQNTKQLASNVKNMSPEDMDVFMEILNYVDLPLKSDGNSKGILDIAGWFNPQMYNNLKYLHEQLAKSKNLNFQMYCARHLDKIIDYGIGFNKRTKSRKKIARLLLIAAVLIYLLVKFGLITSISLPFTIGISATIGVIGLGLMAYNYFKLKIIEKAMKLFGCPEWYRIEFGIESFDFATTNEGLSKERTPEEQQMYNLVCSIFSLRRKMHLAERTTIKTKNLTKMFEPAKTMLSQKLKTTTGKDRYNGYDNMIYEVCS